MTFGSCDCHVHVFGPYDRYPLAADRSYTPPEAPVAQLSGMLDASGVARAVLVQPSAYGSDHAALCNALATRPESYRGVAVVGQDVADAHLERLHSLGVRAARFTETGNGGARFTGAVGFDQFKALAPRLAHLGWHAQLWAASELLDTALDRLLDGGVPLVLDHMGMLDVAAGTGAARFRRVLREVADGRLWIKLTPQRVSREWPLYRDVEAFVVALVEANPARLVWASDWPYLRMGEQTPAQGALLSWLEQVVPDEALRAMILRDNAARLYGF